MRSAILFVRNDQACKGKTENFVLSCFISKVLKALPWDKVDIEVVMVELEHAGKVIFALLGFLTRQTFGAQIFVVDVFESLPLSTVSGVSWIETGCACFYARKRLRLCWITV